MIITIDTQKLDDPNAFGEALRKYAFKEEYGCYSCFDLQDSFVEIKPPFLKTNYKDQLDIEKLYNWYADHLVFDGDPVTCNYEEDLEIMKVYVDTNFNISLGWFWDGDGHLIIREGNIAAENFDCKKDYTWRWLKIT